LVNLGLSTQITVEEGKSLLPQLEEDGTWHLKSRGDIKSNIDSIIQNLNLERYNVEIE
jgi:hypothetical protein